MTPRERAETILEALIHVVDQRALIERHILADRQALQSELEKRLKAAHETWMHQGIIEGPTQCGLLYNFRREIQSVFAQQSQPKEGKPDTGYDPSVIRVTSGDGQILYQRPEGWTSESECQMRIKAESDRRVLVEREACAKAAISWTSDYREVDICHKAAAAIRARSNQPEGKDDAKIKTVPIKTHENLDAYAFYVEKVNDWQSTRIATLHEWQARDALAIQQLNESNNLLSKKIAQLEKEKNELTQKIELFTKAHATGYDDRCAACQHGIQH